MANVVLRQAAIDDLNAIWNYTADKWSEEQADNYYESLKLGCNQIGMYPGLGKEYDEIKKNLYGLRKGKHIIFYQIISEKEIEIIRILHERMDIKNRI
jgi:toxin ParE1/3/4